MRLDGIIASAQPSFLHSLPNLELIDQTNYLNHYYLISLISFLMLFCPLHRAFAIDAWRQPTSAHSTVPAGILWLLRIQIALVYLFAGLSKINLGP